MRTILIASIMALLAGPVHADATQDALAEIARCADLSDPTARLKCFDAAAPQARRALTEAQSREKRGILDWFGFSRPPKPVTRPEEFGKPAAPAEPGEITQLAATVTEFAKTPRGKAIFILDNGQIWRQLDSDSVDVIEPAPGKPMKVTIEVGFLGSYNLSVDGRNAIVKVRRLK